MQLKENTGKQLITREGRSFQAYMQKQKSKGSIINFYKLKHSQNKRAD